MNDAAKTGTWRNELTGAVVEVMSPPQDGFGDGAYRLGGDWYPCMVVRPGDGRTVAGQATLEWLDGPGWVQA